MGLPTVVNAVLYLGIKAVSFWLLAMQLPPLVAAGTRRFGLPKDVGRFNLRRLADWTVL
ncbi:hypothetical protein [Nostoc piscinale]|uniref:hypothetical protein n=1 Tax=Nostoc piscinale TaxID=224012 RepID=UPI001F215430|nr:hypothetical protein [Nostoc piscinale]